ncbi:hypothetical protein D7S86_20750 [Pararobbsia silviterrae]|uniref:Uncharacterized protein n=1 Tax=Pararobbsia silviterrae TaxID=1792498 RepID=A0A494XQA9_9BURK|nr:hypothetical protein D7S86_20750 [Pararobbsia silviterrae]
MTAASALAKRPATCGCASVVHHAIDGLDALRRRLRDACRIVSRARSARNPRAILRQAVRD